MLGLGTSLIYDKFVGGFVNSQALNFDGANDSARWPADSTFEDLVGNSSFTISAWCQYNVPASSQGSTGNSLLGDTLEFVSSNLLGLQLGVMYGEGHATVSSRDTMVFSLILGSTTYFNTVVEDISDYVTDGQYFHLAYRSAASGGARTGNIYINGVDRTSSDSSTSGNFSGVGILNHRFGAKNQLGSLAHYTRGKLDEFSIYNIALDQTRIAQLYNNGCPLDDQSTSSVIGYWRMEEASGDALDTSSNSNDIERIGATFTTATPC